MKKLLLLFSIVCLFMFFFIGCTTKQANNQGVPDIGLKNEPNTAQTNTTEKILYDKSKTTQYNIPSTGGFISISNNEERFDIVFTENSIEKDMTFNVSPINKIPNKNQEFFSYGFYLSEKGSDDSVKLKMPASICYTTSKEIPNNTVIVKYNEDGNGYNVVPTQRITIKGVNGLIATVQSFSGYGIKTVTQEEINKMGDMMLESGLDWVLKVDDEVIMNIPGEEGGEVNFSTNLQLSLENTERKDSWAMYGAYKGDACLKIGVDISIEDQNFSSNFIGNAENESFRLYPVLKIYDTADGGLPLVGLVPENYMGIGILHFKWDHVKTDNGGADIVDIAGLFGVTGDAQEQSVMFSVVTNGPYAELVLVDFNNLGPLVYDGIIIGHEKNNPKDLDSVELVDLAEKYRDKISRDKKITDNSDGSVSYDKNGDGKNTITVNQTENGSLNYDINGDGEYDIELAPLTIKN